jgi:DUF1707 SHOCT-like domain/Cell wall-active antibiotics response LiaF, C-terminal
VTDAPAVRASDADRERVVAQLREHCAQGRLTLEEFAARMDEAYAARTLGELEPVLRELPESARAAARPQRGARSLLVSVLGGLDRRGRWRVPRRLTVISVLGGTDLDLRQAQIADDEVTITIVDVLGGVDLYVPEGIEVDVGGVSLLGGLDEHGSDVAPRPGTPLVRVKVFSLLGGVDVWHVRPRSTARTLRELRRSVER